MYRVSFLAKLLSMFCMSSLFCNRTGQWRTEINSLVQRARGVEQRLTKVGELTGPPTRFQDCKSFGNTQLWLSWRLDYNLEKLFLPNFCCDILYSPIAHKNLDLCLDLLPITVQTSTELPVVPVTSIISWEASELGVYRTYITGWNHKAVDQFYPKLPRANVTLWPNLTWMRSFKPLQSCVHWWKVWCIFLLHVETNMSGLGWQTAFG